MSRGNAQLRHEVDSHARVEIAVHQVSPAAGFEVLREVTQHIDIDLYTVADMVIGRASGESLPRLTARELDTAVDRRQGHADTEPSS
ncbi:ANTAR domain-containing protein [Streptomyces prasinus]